MADSVGDRLHILIIPSWYPTPNNPVNGIFFREQAHALIQQGMKVGVLYPQMHSLRQIWKRETSSFGLEVEHDNGLPTYRSNSMNYFSKLRRGRAWLLRRSGTQLFEEYVQDHGMPDILHAHSALEGGVVGAHIKSSYQVPLVLTEHATTYARQTLTKQQYEEADYAFSMVDCLISVSPQLGAVLGEQFPRTKNRWRWIPNVVDNRFFEEAITSRTGLHPFVFLNVAVMTEKKGQLDLLVAFARGFKDQPDVELWLGGDGPIRGELEKVANELGVSAQVRFMGMLSRTQVTNAIQTADVFVISSHYETFGVVLAEALAMGTPVIATRCGGPECIVRKEDGLLVPVGDTGALAAAMEMLRANTFTYDPDEIRSSCQARFGVDAVVAQLSQVYRNLLAPSKSGTLTTRYS